MEDGKGHGWVAGPPSSGSGCEPSSASTSRGSGLWASGRASVSPGCGCPAAGPGRGSLWGTGGGVTQQAWGMASLQGPSLGALGLGGPDSAPDPSLSALWTTPHRQHSVHPQVLALHCRHYPTAGATPHPTATANHTCKMAATGTAPTPHSGPHHFPSNLNLPSQAWEAMGMVALAEPT